ncbi:MULTISPECIES: hypothetical protein [unclassified Mesorhizobium]|uniref:hypothetical protein n=1 Tax=unclassified Mesorhizobium TaxID=325217 RepID=UPI001CCD52FF|nr:MULTISPECIES: hypothetical protein [unclassified Mesorhizobium]MBZ9741017.1 hypothetical protein [Mesorhizobium sp. CO1-1-4]MBZ9804374.1 hypothetical protein [Mesorhizobium sp. ES1-6]
MAKSPEFRVLSLAEADSEYATIETHLTDLMSKHSAAHREASVIEADILARPAPRMRSGVAELLGNTVDTSLQQRPERLKEKRHQVADLEDAIEILRRRLADRRGKASVAVCAAVREEYGLRVAKICVALNDVDAAAKDAEKLLDALDREDVALSYLPPMRPTFMSGYLHYLKEAQEAGYVS